MTPLPPDVALHLPRIPATPESLLWFDCVTSTNDIAASLAERGAKEGTTVAAEMQTAGRGRMGRSWISPPGAGLYASVIFRPPDVVAPMLTIAAGVAIAEGISAATGFAPDLKWPNDIHAGRRKLGGILAEAGTSAAGEPFVVVGFGINVLAAALPPHVAARATCLEAELGRAVDRGLILAECLRALRRRYDDLRGGHRAAVLDAWRGRAAATLGYRVEWDEGGVPLRGVAAGIDPDGALLVSTDAGVQRVISGEVRWV